MRNSNLYRSIAAGALGVFLYWANGGFVPVRSHPVGPKVYAQALNPQMIAAVKQKDAARVRTLLTEGGDPNCRLDGYGLMKAEDRPTVLMEACNLGDLATAGVLLHGGADINLHGASLFERAPGMRRYWSTPLIDACYRENIAVVRFLLAYGANVGAGGLGAGGHGAAIDAAYWASNSEEIRLLVRHGAEPRPELVTPAEMSLSLVMAISQGVDKRVKTLLSKGADPNGRLNEDDRIKNNQSTTILMAACGSGRVETVKALLDGGADVNLRGDSGCGRVNDPAHHGSTPLIDACYRGNAAIVEVLLDHGAQVNARDHGNHTPLSVAISRSNRKMISLLLSHRAIATAVQRKRITDLMRMA